ncbi:MAG: ion transporter [Verrucomicrobia bacterium]|nr:ion transporter [Verrucomicrobiota bacterium]
MILLAKQVVGSRWFHGAIVIVILCAGILAGVETNSVMVAAHGPLLHALDAAVLAIFICEIVLKLVAHGRRPLDYFRDGWNVFDFIIVAICLLPIGGPFAAVLRLARVLRLLRLVTALPKLQMLVGALIKSFSSMGYVGLLLGVMFYIYAIMGVHLFGNHDAEHFGSLASALMSLFQIITLDNWSDIFATAKGSAPGTAAAYFVTFILLGTMIMLNLFIGVIMNSMTEMHAELDAQKQDPSGTHADELLKIERQLAALRRSLAVLTPAPRPSSETQ